MIIKIILESYKKKIGGNPLEKHEYVLGGLEIKEIDLLKSQAERCKAILLTLSKSISGKMICSLIPIL